MQPVSSGPSWLLAQKKHPVFGKVEIPVGARHSEVQLTLAEFCVSNVRLKSFSVLAALRRCTSV
jgi:hypothetical protein